VGDHDDDDEGQQVREVVRVGAIGALHPRVPVDDGVTVAEAPQDAGLHDLPEDGDVGEQDAPQRQR
jgi:uridine phosphorylase